VATGSSPTHGGLSVRARLTFAVSALAAAAFAGVAIIAPGAVEDVLLDDLLTAEAESALFFAQINDKDFTDADLLRDDKGNVFEFDMFDAKFSDGGFVTTGIAFQSVESEIGLLQSVSEFDRLVTTAGGQFVIEMPQGTFAIVDADANIELLDGGLDAIVELGVPLLTSDELAELIFDDLGVFKIGSGSLVDTDSVARIAKAVVEVDGTPLLVSANASSVERSVSRIRSGLWLAVPVLTALVALLAWLVTNRALRPVRSITEQAATITSGSLDSRVPIPPSGDEISSLAVTMNEMLDRLEVDDRSRRRFISDASHELRSPVAVMRNEAEVAMHYPDVADVHALATTIADESKRMSTIIDDLLALARHDEGVPTPSTDVDLDDIVLAEAARSRNVPVDATQVSAGRIRGRSDELGRMVGHLLDNASRHASSAVSVSLTTSDSGVKLTVDDDGPGIASADRERIFDRFARLDDARTRDQGGAGLGLAVVRGIAERSGGGVAVDDSPLGGARFVVSFPR
jgi:signal transduction histidine kinase